MTNDPGDVPGPLYHWPLWAKILGKFILMLIFAGVAVALCTWFLPELMAVWVIASLIAGAGFGYLVGYYLFDE